MSARTGFCTLAVALAGVWLLFAPRPAFAQAAPSDSTDQRLRRLEEKIDKLLAAKSDVTESKSQPVPDGSGLALLNHAAEKFKQALEAAQRDWDALVRRTSNNAPAALFLERLAKIQARRQQLQAEVSEAEQNYAQIEQAYKKDGKGVALRKLSENLDRQFMALTVARKQLMSELGPAHPQIRTLDEQLNFIKKLYGQGIPPAIPPGPADDRQTDADVVQVILTAMKAETESKKQRIQAFNREFEAQLKDALEVNKHEPERLRLKTRLDEAKQDLDTVLRAIREIESRRGPK